MEFLVKSPGDPAKVVDLTPEVIANQRVGTRLAFCAAHDLTVEFAGGAARVDDVDLIIYIVPDEYFCYRGDQLVLRFTLDCRRVALDCRPPAGSVNGRAILSGSP